MPELKLIDFDIFDDELSLYNIDSDSDSDNEDYYAAKLCIRMFGIDVSGATHCVNVTGYKPFFYIRVTDNWTKYKTRQFRDEMSNRMGYYRNTIHECKLVEKHTLYGFEIGRAHV